MRKFTLPLIHIIIEGNKVFIEKLPINIGETYKVSFQNWFKNQ